jgi:N-acetylmuramoyl-L-alanine amidase
VSGTVGSVRLVPTPEWIDVRLSTSDRLPFEVRAEESALVISVYGAETRTNWLHYGHADPLVLRAEWQQERDDLYTVRLELAERVWGWRAFWDESGALVVRVRRPPRIDVRMPMRGLRVAVDAGHPPGGAIGPTGLTEAEANLAIARHLVRMLRVGARLQHLALTRPTWMPSVLTETMFLMIPQQEAALRDPAVHERIAAAHFRAIRAFLEGRAQR